MFRKSVLLSFVVVFVFGALATAQQAGRGNNEFYFGYAHLTANKNGWNASAAHNFGERFGLEGDLGGYYQKGFDVHSFLAGPKYTFDVNSYKFTPWAHFLLGAAHTNLYSGDTGFAFALGGGVDWNWTDNWAGRVKLDLFHDNFFSEGDSHFRPGLGITYRWK